MRWPVLVALGGTQCVFWGIVYYAFSVLLVPMRTEWPFPARRSPALSQWVWPLLRRWRRASGARWIGHGVALLRGGALAGAALLVAWSYGFLKAASENELAGILGYEERPLVSIDYRGDPRSGIVDALSTMVVNGTHVKIYAWYDNEWGYVNRTAELVRLVGGAER
jgi:hypothetical protein